jgi:hypothetical protein
MDSERRQAKSGLRGSGRDFPSLRHGFEFPVARYETTSERHEAQEYKPRFPAIRVEEPRLRMKKAFVMEAHANVLYAARR